MRIEASGMCGSDLHIYHGRVQIEPGFTIGHEYRRHGARGRRATSSAPPSATACSGCFQTACGTCVLLSSRADYHRVRRARTFGHGATLGSLQGDPGRAGARAERDLSLRRVPEGMSDDVALFAGDVMGTGYHAVADERPARRGHRRRARPRAGGPVRRAGGARALEPRMCSRSTRSPRVWRWPSRSARRRSI